VKFSDVSVLSERVRKNKSVSGPVVLLHLDGLLSFIVQQLVLIH
jgi:hypothetical protein